MISFPLSRLIRLCLSPALPSRDQLVDELKPNHGSVIRACWHHRINQIFCASSDGTVNVHYDPVASHHGALMCANRQSSMATRRLRQGTNEAYVKPYLLMYDEEAVRLARKQRKLQNLPDQSVKLAVAAANVFQQKEQQGPMPNRPSDSAQGSKLRAPVPEETLDNRVGSLHQYMVQQIVLQKNEADERAEKDIRGAILRHAADAKAKPFWTKAYQK